MAGIQGLTFKELVEDHIKSQSALQIKEKCASTILFLKPVQFQHRAMGFIQHIFPLIKDPEFWDSDCPAVLVRIVQEASTFYGTNLCFEIVNLEKMSSWKQELLFNLFEIVTLTFAYNASIDKNLRILGTMKMREYPHEMLKLDFILTSYIEIHNKISRFPIRNFVPFKWLFKPEPYCYGNLVFIRDSLNSLITYAPRNEDLPGIFWQYCYALLDAIEALLGICSKLDRLSSYSYRDYKSDVLDYKILVEKYHSLGMQLDDYINTYIKGQKQHV